MPFSSDPLNVNDQEAWDLAQFVKRFGFTEARNNAADEVEAYRMIDIIVKIQQTLANERIQPR